MIVIEESIDENTGLACWLIVDSATHTTLDRVFDAGDARDIADYYTQAQSDPFIGTDEFDYEDDSDWRDYL